MIARRAPLVLGAALGGVALVAGLVWVAASGAARVDDPIRIGAVFPLTSSAADLADQELAGVRIAARLVNDDGGVAGRPISLVVRDLDAAADAPAVMAALKAVGVSVVIGSYSSDLSIAASAAANSAGLVYWESGAVADQLTGRGLPLVFRVGPSGTDLGSNSARFAATQLAPRLGLAPADLRLAVVNAVDAYASSVADAAAATAATEGVRDVTREAYDLSVPRWSSLMTALKAAQPDIIILASHIPDAIAFRQAMLAAGLHVKALIGSTMAECDPDFAGELGSDAIGIFASDRPTGGFQPQALQPAARAIYDRLAVAWAAEQPASTTTAAQDWYGSPAGASPSAGYSISGPVAEGSLAAGPPEEVLAGFSAAWALFHDVLPGAVTIGQPVAEHVASVARSLDLPPGSQPDGAGVRFSSDAATLGQNERATAVIWQWQAVRAYTFVWPATYATGAIGFVPLGR